MKPYEKRLLKSLGKKDKNIIRKSFTIEVTNRYFIKTFVKIDANPPEQPLPIYTTNIEERLPFDARTEYPSLPDMILFGKSDYLNTYNISRKFKYEGLNPTSGYPSYNLDPNGYYLLTDNLTDRKNVEVSFFPTTDQVVEFQAFDNESFRQGDLLQIQFVDAITQTGGGQSSKTFRWTETIVRCKEIPYISLIDLLNEGKINAKSITYNFEEENPLGNTELYVRQADMPITLIRYNYLGEYETDSFNPSIYITKYTKNPKIVDIPIRFNFNNLAIHIPMSFGIAKHILIFHT